MWPFPEELLAIDSHVEGMAATRLSLFSTILTVDASSVKAASAPAHPHRLPSPRSSSSQTHASPGHPPRPQVRRRPKRYLFRHRLPAICSSSRLPTFARHPARSSRVPPKPASRFHHRSLPARGQPSCVPLRPGRLPVQTARVPSHQLSVIGVPRAQTVLLSVTSPIALQVWRRLRPSALGKPQRSFQKAA